MRHRWARAAGFLITAVAVAVSSSDAAGSQIGRSTAWRRGYADARPQLRGSPKPIVSQRATVVVLTAVTGSGDRCVARYDALHLSTRERLSQLSQPPDLQALVRFQPADDAVWPVPADIAVSPAATRDYRRGWISGCDAWHPW